MDNLVKIDPFGFREYDARWLYPDNINLKGIINLGKGLGSQIIHHTKKNNPRVVVGHDYRSYSEEIKENLKKGLISTGCFVEDLGLSLSPMVYFAQFNLDSDAVAMVTASHNENGWTGVKMGIKKGLTHAPEEMKELKEITLKSKFLEGKGKEKKIENFQDIYKNDLIKKNKLNKKIKVIAACGNGTAGIFAPDILRGIGCEVVELDCKLDWTFPKYNPNPEDMEMLHAISKAVIDNNADIGFGFDGDGDRCGVIDNKGKEIFSDKIGLLIARNLSKDHKKSKFVVDVKSTGLFFNSEILKKNNCTVDMWKTGHSHMKRRVNEINALCGFEKSGHFFIGKPLGLGFDDGLRSASMMIEYLDHHKDKSMSELYSKLNTSYQSPTMAPFCKDEEKYDVVDEITNKIIQDQKNKTKVADCEIVETNTVNGIRFSLSNGSWGLIRASSNKPSLVIVIESLVSNEEVEMIFKYINTLLNETGKVGEFDQKL